MLPSQDLRGQPSSALRQALAAMQQSSSRDSLPATLARTVGPACFLYIGLICTILADAETETPEFEFPGPAGRYTGRVVRQAW
jgi:hypothetical protein